MCSSKKPARLVRDSVPSVLHLMHCISTLPLNMVCTSCLMLMWLAERSDCSLTIFVSFLCPNGSIILYLVLYTLVNVTNEGSRFTPLSVIGAGGFGGDGLVE